MSEKGRGSKIVLQFTDDITSTPAKNAIDTQGGAWTANGTYSGSSVENAKDGITTTYWRSDSASNYIQVYKLGLELTGFSVYKGDTYRPTTYTVERSDNGVTFTTAATGSFVAATGWERIDLANAVVADYIRIKFGLSSRVYVYELKLHTREWGMLVAEWQERLHVGGPLVTKTGIISDISKDVLDASKLIVTMRPILGRFNNVEGQLTVTYSSAIGQLAGRGGLVADFTRAFTPTELEQVPHQNDAENVEITGIAVTATRTRVYYTNSYDPENIELASISATGTLTHIDDL